MHTKEECIQSWCQTYIYIRLPKEVEGWQSMASGRSTRCWNGDESATSRQTGKSPATGGRWTTALDVRDCPNCCRWRCPRAAARPETGPLVDNCYPAILVLNLSKETLCRTRGDTHKGRHPPLSLSLKLHFILMNCNWRCKVDSVHCPAVLALMARLQTRSV